MVNFPHLKNSSPNFPGLNIDNYKMNSDFDYSKYDTPQMTITCCNVPWDLGEAHVGQKTITGIGNVVYFETEEKRDKWFDNIPDNEKFVWTTKFRAWHDGETIKIPLPYTQATKYNYIIVDYQDLPVEYENETNGWKRWFLFMREIKAESPNSSTCICMFDIWQLIVYRLSIKGMILNRGHAPMADITVENFLKNPIENNSGLVTPDVSFGEITKLQTTQAAIINNTDEDLSVILAITGGADENSFTTGGMEWFDEYDEIYKTPSINPSTMSSNLPQGISFLAFDSDIFPSFMLDVRNYMPHFFQTIQAAYLIPNNYFEISRTYTWRDYSFYRVSSNTKAQEVGSYTFNKSDFNIDSKYADIAKLYTYPYSVLEIANENGVVATLRPQDCSNIITFNARLNNVFTGLKFIGYLNGIGGTAKTTVNFNLLSSKEFTATGRWYSTLLEWNIPTYAVTLASEYENNYSTLHTREQMSIAATNSKNDSYQLAKATQSIANNSASANRSIANNSASGAYTIAERNADFVVDKADLEVAANDTITDINTSAATSKTSASIDQTDGLTLNANVLISGTEAAENEYKIESAAIANNAAMEGAAINAAIGVASSVASLASGDIGGAIGSGVNAITGVAQTAITNEARTATTTAAVNLNTANSSYALQKNNSDRNDTVSYNNEINSITVSAMNDNNDTQHQLFEDEAELTHDVTIANASTQYSVNTSNASTQYSAATGNASTQYNAAINSADYQYNTEINAIDNLTRQNMLRAPFRFGVANSTGYETVKPQGIFFNIVTQSQGSIELAGNEMLRYGYYYNSYYDFDGNFNKMPKFTFWKCDDIWTTAPNIPDLYMDKFRMFLIGGVTVWSKPEYIGVTSIFDNV